MKAKNIYLVLLSLLGIGAVFGGSILIISPSGKLLGNLLLSILEHFPFEDFLLPGIILLFVLGICPCGITIVIFVALLPQVRSVYKK